MSRSEQLTADREPVASRRAADAGLRRDRERAAKRSLRAQIARLERELSEVVAHGFPHVVPVPARAGSGSGAAAVPRLLDLAELERQRDALVQRLREAQATAAARAAAEAQARRLLAEMRLEPGRYKFTRLRVADLGEGGCGVWEVRPRLGLIGMLAGWWQLKLSSGCPLSEGPHARAAPSPLSLRSPRPGAPLCGGADGRPSLGSRRLDAVVAPPGCRALRSLPASPAGPPNRRASASP